jgi:RimJ/RimL family protein N-acetyltransferase
MKTDLVEFINTTFRYKMNLQPTLTNDLITLKPLVETDFDALYNVASDKLIWEQHPNNDRYQKSVFKEFFAIALASKGAFVIIDNKSNSIIGSSRYYEYDAEKKQLVIGYTFIARSYWGTNYNRTLKELMMNYAFQFVDVIHFHVGKTNFRSIKAMEKLGGEIIGHVVSVTGIVGNPIYEIKKEKKI